MATARDRREDDSSSTDALERALVRLVRLGRLSPMHEQLAAGAGIAIDRALYLVLATVGDDGPLRLSDVAHRQGVDVSTASRQVTIAEQRGLIARSPDPADRRAARLQLSPEGRRVLDAYRRERRHLLDAILAGWDDAERRTLVELLERLNVDLSRALNASPASSLQRTAQTR